MLCDAANLTGTCQTFYDVEKSVGFTAVSLEVQAGKFKVKVLFNFSRTSCGMNCGMNRGMNCGMNCGINCGMNRGMNCGMNCGMNVLLQKLQFNFIPQSSDSQI